MFIGEKCRWHFTQQSRIGEIAQCTNSPTSLNHDRNTVEQSELNCEPQKTNFRHPQLHLISTLTCRPSISPSSLGKPSPPILIKVKEAFQKKSDEGWRGVALLAVCGFEHPEKALAVQARRLTVWGQCLSPSRALRSHSHTCLSKERAAEHDQENRKRESRVIQSKRQRERVFNF